MSSCFKPVHLLRFLLPCCIGAALAGQALSPAEGLQLLNRVTQATRQQSFVGVYVYQRDTLVETSRITHQFADGNSYEKLEALDGPAQELIRANNMLSCYVPANRSDKVDYQSYSRFFPDVLPNDNRALLENYHVIRQDMERVADHDCQMVLLAPKDGLRNPFRFCYEPTRAVLLKAQVYNDRQELLEQMSFTQVNIGGVIDRNAFKPRLPNKVGAWQRSDGPVKADDLIINEKQLPAGFKLVRGSKRQLPGKPAPVSHYLFSDGLASMSVFLEFTGKDARPPEGASRQKDTNILVETDDDAVMMLLGEVPKGALQQLGSSLRIKPKR